MASLQPTEYPSQSIYDFTLKDAHGNDVKLSDYKGKVLLLVNVASNCGMTNANYTELNQLYDKYKDQGLEILAFPCNQFGDEEPGSNNEIKDFVCTRFKSKFPIFDKIEVNGENAAPLYKFLKLGKWGIFGDDIQWNFAKFLVDKSGHTIGRYYPTTSPLCLEIRSVHPSFWIPFSYIHFHGMFVVAVRYKDAPGEYVSRFHVKYQWT